MELEHRSDNNVLVYSNLRLSICGFHIVTVRFHGDDENPPVALLWTSNESQCASFFYFSFLPSSFTVTAFKC